MNERFSQFPSRSIHEFPVVTVEEMREVDRIMIEEVGISLEQMMENAGLRLAEFVRRVYGKEARVCLLIGKGHNGGGGLAAARHLFNHGHRVEVLLATPGHFFREAGIQQLRILHNMQVPIFYAWDESRPERLEECLQHSAVLIDALIGYSLVGRPQDVYADLISRANDSGKPIVALDTPSGLSLTTGKPFNPAIRAQATVTLAAPKSGLLRSQARDNIGTLFVADISIPDVVWKELGQSVQHLFQDGPLLRVEF